MTTNIRTVFLLVLLLLLPSIGSPLYAQDMPDPVVSEPTTGGTHARPFGSAAANLPAGYVEEERFLSGTARSYARVGDWLRDGRWEARPAGEAAYAVRLLVRRPADPVDFNGVVVVEWLNVSAMAEGGRRLPAPARGAAARRLRPGSASARSPPASMRRGPG